MGTTLTGSQINNTYDGLIKTTDNTALSATTKLISDGLGNDSCIKVGTAGTDFLGNVDFSAATVTGLPGGAAGLESGSGVDSMQSAASLTTVAANASGTRAIALGDGSVSSSGNTVALGWNSNASGNNSMAIGPDSATASTCRSIAIGPDARATGFQFPVAIGYAACAPQSSSIAIGNNTNAGYGIAIGNSVTTFAGGQAVSIGHLSDATGNESTAYGYSAQATGSRSIAIGSSSTASATSAIAIGRSISATAAGAVGLNTSASIADTVSVKALETQTASTPTAGGIIMTDAGSTARRLNIDATGNLQIDSTPVGAAGLVAGTGADSMKNADSLVTNPATASGLCSIALGDGASAAGLVAVAIGLSASAPLVSGTAVGAYATASSAGTALGNAACAAGGTSVSLGDSSDATADGSIAIGYTANASATCAVAIGRGVNATTADTVSVKALETQTASTPTAGGIIMTDAGSVARRLNIDASGNLQIDSTPVGGGGAAGLVSGAATDSMKNADSLVTNPATVGAIASYSITLGDNATSSNIRNIAIGQEAFVSANNGTAVGACSRSTGDSGLAIGFRACGTSFWGGVAAGASACVSGNYGVAIGPGAIASAACAVALGRNVTASRADTVAGNQFESKAVGKGIVVTSPDGLTTLGIGIDNTGAIVTYTP